MRIILSVPLMLAFCAPATASGENGYGNITISGVVTDAPCSVAPGDDDLQVNFGQVATAALAGGGETAARTFSLSLLRCATEVKSQVRIMFSGSAFSDGLFMPGDNSSFGILIRDSQGQPVIGGQPVAWQTLADGDNTLQFSAALKGRAASIVPGDFHAQVLFYLAYQ